MTAVLLPNSTVLAAEFCLLYVLDGPFYYTKKNKKAAGSSSEHRNQRL
jgi:hypothetical protein